MIDVLRSYVATRKFQLYDFVILPDHLPLLIRVDGDMTIEKAMQFIKGGFSFRLRKEFGYLGDQIEGGHEVCLQDGLAASLCFNLLLPRNLRPVQTRGLPGRRGGNDMVYSGKVLPRVTK